MLLFRRSIGIVCILFLLQSASAQQTDTSTVHNLLPVEVQSALPLNTQKVEIGKMNISPMDLPQSIVTLNNALFTKQQSQRLGDVIKNVNGVYLGDNRGGVQETIFARGYSFGSDNLFKNGSRVNNGAMPEISSLEKIEILKGSAAILYGSVAPGAILNMVTKKPMFTQGGEVGIRAGSYNLYKPSVDVYGPISKKIAFRVNGIVERANSFRDVVKSSREYINPSLLFKPDSKTDIILEGDYLNADITPDYGIGSIADTMISTLARNVYLGTNWQYNKVKQTSTNLGITRQLPAGKQLKLSVSNQHFDRDYFSTERVQAKGDGTWARQLNKIQLEQNYISATADLTGNFNTGKMQHKFLVGADADQYRTQQFAFDQSRFYDTINIYDTDRSGWRTDVPTANPLTRLKTPVSRIGVYAQDLVSITSKIKLLAGMRFSAINQGAPTTLFIKNDSSTAGAKKISNAWSPRLGLVYQPSPRTSLFGSYSNSFTLNTGTDIYGNAVDPSYIDQIEAGIKNNFFKNRFSVNITAYQITNSNLAQPALQRLDGSLNTDVNVKELSGETRSKGIEVDLSAKPTGTLEILAGYSFNEMRFTKTSKAAGSFIEGQKLIFNPAHTANASAWYTLWKTDIQQLRFGLTAIYMGKRNAGYNDRVGQSQNFSRIIPVDGYSTLDASLIYDYKNINIATRLSNLYNTYNYHTHENYSINPIAPRQFLITGTYSWKKK